MAIKGIISKQPRMWFQLLVPETTTASNKQVADPIRSSQEEKVGFKPCRTGKCGSGGRTGGGGVLQEFAAIIISEVLGNWVVVEAGGRYHSLLDLPSATPHPSKGYAHGTNCKPIAKHVAPNTLEYAKAREKLRLPSGETWQVITQMSKKLSEKLSRDSETSDVDSLEREKRATDVKDTSATFSSQKPLAVGKVRGHGVRREMRRDELGRRESKFLLFPAKEEGIGGLGMKRKPCKIPDRTVPCRVHMSKLIISKKENNLHNRLELINCEYESESEAKRSKLAEAAMNHRLFTMRLPKKASNEFEVMVEGRVRYCWRSNEGGDLWGFRGGSGEGGGKGIGPEKRHSRNSEEAATDNGGGVEECSWGNCPEALKVDQNDETFPGDASRRHCQASNRLPFSNPRFWKHQCLAPVRLFRT
ncbi:hypothetical protein BDK51DRAFT_26164 [Blyttiomyces helicus]|uniref:Uncharacterized protein n=1 Tax=Blyttiomyces helicus TaxID=388810 RepID=A0A4P9W9N7_9FUNG|nr:hypothetical protein BDK51DRAFT_26164 [Blyttiomyces helicus]|eukprot:RKO87530.1 hypothetical protein BDK51DRAFT_26164 [Blyttiomyces helicus]